MASQPSSREDSAADLMSLGEHCAVPECQQRDFLPFTCDCCQEVFCLEHRTYQSHSCPAAGTKESTVIVCPLCAKGIRLGPDGDANAAFDAHSRAGCDPSNYAKVHRKPRCPVAGCKEKMTTINTYLCKDCGLKVCLKHRFPSDHACVGRVAAAARAAAARRPPVMAQMRSFFSSGAGGSSSSSSKPASAAGAAGKARAPPVRAQPKPQPAARAAVPSQAASNSGQPAQEVCTECGAVFPSIMHLIRHAEANHTPGRLAGNNGRPAGGDDCPHCGRSFMDPVDLVNHVEREHAKSSANCVLS